MLKNLIRNQRGATMVLSVFIVIAALGFTALVVDIGNVALQKQNFQNAIDAALMAAARDLPDTASARATAQRYVEINGFAPENIEVTFSKQNTQIDIKGSKKINYFFAGVLGLKSTTLQLDGAAALTAGSAFDYAVFSGSTTRLLTFNGSDYYIKGSTHTNNSFRGNGSRLTITGVCEAVGTVTLNGSGTNVALTAPNASVVDMPDFSEQIKKQAEAAGQYYNGSKTFNSSSIDVSDPIYVKGNVTINGSRFTGVGCIFATGSITFNGSSQNVSAGDAVCIYSQSGDITVNGSSAKVDGILYAPNGCINMNGSGQLVNGRVVGQTVELNGSNIQIISGAAELKSIPGTYVRLIR